MRPMIGVSLERLTYTKASISGKLTHVADGAADRTRMYLVTVGAFCYSPDAFRPRLFTSRLNSQRLAMLNFSGKCLLLFALSTGLIGCAGGPLGLAQWNPYYRKEWQKDELAGPTFHTQLAELRGIRNNPQGLTAQERRQLMPVLTSIVRDSTNAVLRAEATLTLAEFTEPETLPALKLALNDEDADVRIAACKAWGRRGGQEALELLTDMVRDDKSLDVRLVATSELAKFKDQQAIQSLAVALNDKDPALQHRAVQSLKSVSGQDYGDNVPAWREFVQGRSPALPPPPTIAERLRSLSWF